MDKNDPDDEYSFFAAYGKDNLKMAGEMMDTMLDEIVTEATK